jgi:hypothetical protein
MLFTSACGSSQTVPPPTYPSPALVRSTYGLDSGSCWRYTLLGANTEAVVTVEGPDTNAVAGRSVYAMKYQPQATTLTNDDYFDTESKGEIRLLRHIEGPVEARVDKRYDMDPSPPLFARFVMGGAMNAAILGVGQTFSVTTTPAGGMAEMHEWDVLANDDMVMVPAYGGMQAGLQKAYKLQYKRTAGGMTGTAIYSIVPGFGAAKFTDFAGQLHQACAAHICDASGNCTGSADCAACPQ